MKTAQRFETPRWCSAPRLVAGEPLASIRSPKQDPLVDGELGQPQQAVSSYVGDADDGKVRGVPRRHQPHGASGDCRVRPRTSMTHHWPSGSRAVSL